MKYIVIVPDGMADWPIKDIGDKTPLEAAHTANMDYLAPVWFWVFLHCITISFKTSIK